VSLRQSFYLTYYQQVITLEQNQNANEQLQSKEVIPLEVQELSEPVTPELSIPASAEEKKETPTPLPELQGTNLPPKP